MSAPATTVASSRLARLSDYLWNNQRKGFEYGRHDCGLFVCRWVDSELGTAYEATVESEVREAGLARTIARLREAGGYRRLVERISGAAPSQDPWSPGDVAVFAQDDGAETLGVLSARLVHSPGITSLVAHDARRVLSHWSLSCLRH